MEDIASTLFQLAAAQKTTADGLKSIALGVGAGLGTIGPASAWATSSARSSSR